MPKRIIHWSRRWLGDFWYVHFLALGFAFAVSPFIVMAMDRTPPFIRLAEGSTIVEMPTPPGGNPKLLYVAVRYVTTKPVRPEEECPGDLQQEFRDNLGNFASAYEKVRKTGPAMWEMHPTDPEKRIFTGRPIPVPVNIVGSSFVVTTNTFRRCNIVHRLLRWPIVQEGPDLVFTRKEKP